MTDNMVKPGTLVEKAPDADLLCEMIGFAAERLMEIEVGAATGAAWGEKSPLRTAQCNGYHDRDWKTRAGTAELRIPKLRKGGYFPGDCKRRCKNRGGEGAAVEPSLELAAQPCAIVRVVATGRILPSGLRDNSL